MIEDRANGRRGVIFTGRIEGKVLELAAHPMRGAGGKAYAHTVDVGAPGPIDAGITKYVPDQERRYLERLPFGRFGLADKGAWVAVFLASNNAAYMAGGVVSLDGGFDSVGPIFSVDELRSLKSDARDAERNG